MHQEATQLQVLIDNYLPLCLMAYPIALKLVLKAMRNHLLKTTWYCTGTNLYEIITHMRNTLVVWMLNKNTLGIKKV